MAFAPGAISGLFAWYDGSDASTITLVSGNVSQWNDKSGKGNHVAQATTTKQPAYSASAGTLTFALANSQNLRKAAGTGPPTGSGAASVFAVSQFTDNAAGCDIITWGSTNALSYCLQQRSGGTSTGYAFLISNGTTWPGNKESGGQTTTNNVVAAVYAGGAETSSSPSIYRNGTLSAMTLTSGTPAASGTDICVGTEPTGAGTNFWNGTISEILCYSAALTTADQQSVEGYLAWKWGLQASLPNTHPYKTGGPGGTHNWPPDIITTAVGDW